MERMHPGAIVVVRAGSFRTEVLQDDAGVVDLCELTTTGRFAVCMPDATAVFLSISCLNPIAL